MLDYEIEEIRNINNRLNEKKTIKEFFKNNPEKFDLGDNAETGWRNLKNQLADELDAYALAEEMKQQAEEAKRKAGEKTIDDSKQEVEEVDGEPKGLKDEEVEKVDGEQEGKGVIDPQKGLTTEQIDGLMSDEKRYLGTVASDEIKTLKPKGAKYAFIMNTDKASKPGQHWIAVYISGKDDKAVEVYDPLGTYEPTKEFLEQIKTLVDKMHLDHYLLLKVNKIKNQSDTSDTCGWFAVKFLKERFLGNRFKFSTGFTQLKEDEIQKYKKQNGYGFDTYL